MGRRLWYRRIVPTGRPLRWVLPLGVLLAFLLVQGLGPDWAARAEAWTVDARFRLRGEQAPRSPIVIVALDEASFQMLGDLAGENIRTWPRARWGVLVEKIAAGNPRLIGLDIVFDTPGWDAGGDDALAQAVAAAGNVVLGAHLEEQGEASYGLATLSPPLPALAAEAAGIGLLNYSLDADGAARKLTAFYRWRGQDYPSFPLTLASLYAGRFAVDGEDLDATGGSFPINFRGPEGTFPTISMHEVWNEEIDPQVFRDAIVLVGYTTLLEEDQLPAPFAGGEGMPGVEVHANAVDTLLAGDWLRRVPTWLHSVLVAAMGLVGLVALSVRRTSAGVAVLLGALLAYVVLGGMLFVRARLLLPIFAPLLVTVAVGGVTLAERTVFAERDKRRLRQRFAGVMSPERLRAVMEHWESLLQADRPQKDAAVLFADVRGFTATTETLMRQGRIPEMVRFLSAYLDAMSGAVFAEGGVVYDVVGDGLMILFGVPESLPDHALRATRAAVGMARATEALQAVWPLRDQRPMRMGIGVHCGPLVDAIVGRGRRVEYSVIGDPVNTAARIEAHCKVAMETPRPPGGEVPETVTILLSADVYDRVREHVRVDASVPPFEARGKSEPLQVVRLLGLREASAGANSPRPGAAEHQNAAP